MSNEKYLWKFYWNCGRDGNVRGLFIASEEEINENLNKDIYFGEILGKHSEVSGTLGEEDLTKMDLDSETVEKVTKVLGSTWSGYNPLGYVREICPKCGDTYNCDEYNYEKNMCDYCAEEND